MAKNNWRNSALREQLEKGGVKVSDLDKLFEKFFEGEVHAVAAALLAGRKWFCPEYMSAAVLSSVNVVMRG